MKTEVFWDLTPLNECCLVVLKGHGDFILQG